MKLLKLSSTVLLVLIFKLNAIGQNIEITNTGNPSEPSIMMDPNNPNVLVAGSNLNFYYTSNDGGVIWSTQTLNSSYGVWGDPVIDIDTSGNFYFTHLSNTPSGNWIDRIVCQKSSDNGNTWSNGTFTGLNGTKAQDKQWTVVDRNNNNIFMTWTEFDDYGSSNPSDSSRILFSKSLDQGVTWSTPLKINVINGDCVDEDNTVEGAVPAVGPSGEIYVSWAGPNGLVFNRSVDQGDTWLTNEISVDPMPGGWDFDIPGLNRANGLPITKCDLSGGANHGTIYINWSDQRNGANNTDIWLSKSTDGGNVWSSPVRVNDDNSNKHQFFTWMDIDQTNGNLYFVFYDRRAYSDNKTDVFIAFSTDGGNTFTNVKISNTPFTPQTGIFFGDYTNIVAHNDIIRPIWTRLNNGQLSIWTDITPLNLIVTSLNELSDNKSTEIIQYPNPTSSISYVSFKLHELSNITLKIYDQQGRMIHAVINNDKMNYGKYIIPIDVNELNLPSGTYYIKILINDKSKTLKTVIIK
jgi:hypothetical protein